MLWVFAYDVVEDRRRSKIAEILLNAGVRVNKSVFECQLSRAAAQRLSSQVGAMLRPGDHLRVYRLCDACRSEVEIRGPRDGAGSVEV
jgi:CRISPR-associated protein Cas2